MVHSEIKAGLFPQGHVTYFQTYGLLPSTVVDSVLGGVAVGRWTWFESQLPRCRVQQQ